MNDAQFESTSELLQGVLKRHPEKEVRLQDLIEGVRETGFSLLLILFAAPLALPLPAIGIAQVMAVPIFLLSAQLFLGMRSPWVPKKIGKKTIKRETLVKIVDTILPWLDKLEHLIRPRIRLLSSYVGIRLIGLMYIICAISIATPVPFSNTVPSMGIVIMSLGLLERDGLVITVGMLVGAAGVTLAISIYYLGYETVKAFFT